MMVVAINWGSATLKLQFVDIQQEPHAKRWLGWSILHKIGAQAELNFSAVTGEHAQTQYTRSRRVAKNGHLHKH